MGIDTSGGMVSFAGLSSGLDTKGIVDAMTRVAEAPLDRLHKQEKTLRDQQGMYTRVSTAMQNLGTVAGTLDSSVDFGVLAASGGDPTVLRAVAGAGSQPGVYQVQVAQLATAQRNYSDPVSDRAAAGLLYTGAPGGQGALSLTTAGGASLTVPVDATTTLEDVALAINGAGLGANASIIADTGGYRLVLSAVEVGAANAITLTETNVGLGISRPANQAQAAQDAEVVLDGISHLTRPTNTIGDAIPGVTLQLSSDSPAAQTITVAVDAQAMVTKVEGFVSAYNAVIGAITDVSGYKGGTDQGRLVGDSTMRQMLMDLQRTLGTALSGQAYSTLAEVGITTQRDGTLKMDEVAFGGDIAAHFDDVARLFIRDPSSGTVGLGVTMQDLSTSYTQFGTGVLPLRGQSIDRQLTSLEDRADTVRRQVDAYTASLKQQFNALEEQMARLRSQNAFLNQSQGH